MYLIVLYSFNNKFTHLYKRNNKHKLLEAERSNVKFEKCIFEII